MGQTGRIGNESPITLHLTKFPVSDFQVRKHLHPSFSTTLHPFHLKYELHIRHCIHTLPSLYPYSDYVHFILLETLKYKAPVCEVT